MLSATLFDLYSLHFLIDKNSCRKMH